MDIRSPQLRPLERRVLRLSESGVDDDEIARRFRRSPEWVGRVRAMAAMHPGDGMAVKGDVLRPIERRILRWRGDGVSHEDLAPRFKRSPGFLARVEHLARHKLTSG
jgi:hypothetical protein